MMYLVDFVIPNIGDTISINDYVRTLVNLGYSKHRAVSSLGGISGRSATISNGYVTRN